MSMILVTGATNKVGRRLVSRLLEQGVAVRAATREPEAFAKQYPKAEALRFDFDRPDTWSAALQGVTRVFLAVPPLDAVAHERVAPFIAQMQSAGVNRVALLSAFGANMNESAPLAIIERQLADASFESTALRPNWFHENFNEGFFAGTISEQNAIFMAAGDGKVSFISAEDIAAAAAQVLLMDETPLPGYDLTGPEALDFGHVATLLSAAVGREISYHPLSEEQQSAALTGQGMPDNAVAYMNVLCNVIREGYAAPTTGDLERLTSSKGMTVEQFVTRHAAAWR